MSQEIDRWNNSDPDRRQEVATPLIAETRRLEDLFQKYDPVLTQDLEGGVPCHIIPEVSITYQGPYHEGVPPHTAKGYFFRHDKKVGAEDRIFGFISESKDGQETTQRLSIDPQYGIATDIDDPTRTFENVELLHTLLDFAEQPLSKKLDERRRTNRTKRAALAALTSVAIMGIGVGAAIKIRADEASASARRAAAHRRAFDKSGFSINGVSYRVGNAALTRMDKTQFDQIPDYRTGDKLFHPRKFDLAEDSCQTFGGALKPGEDVSLGVKAGDAYQNEAFLVAEDTQGHLDVCSPAIFVNNKSNSAATVTLAIQVK